MPIFSKKSTSIDISFDSKFLLNFHVSAPYVTVLLTIELYISNLFNATLQSTAYVKVITTYSTALRCVFLVKQPIPNKVAPFFHRRPGGKSVEEGSGMILVAMRQRQYDRVR